MPSARKQSVRQEAESGSGYGRGVAGAVDGDRQRPDIGDKLTAFALRLLALTFVRTSELIGATWEEADMDGATWIVPAAQTKLKSKRVVPVSRQAVEILREVPAIGGGGRYAFPGRNPDNPLSDKGPGELRKHC